MTNTHIIESEIFMVIWPQMYELSSYTHKYNFTPLNYPAISFVVNLILSIVTGETWG